jgi:predicted type IV restriction endonuclease
MTEQPSDELVESVRGLADKAKQLRNQYRDRNLGEENTKAALISPMLQALGWNVGDPDEVHHEYRHTPKDSPVDYCLKLDRSPKLLVEAKGLGEDLSDHKWIRQTLGYASMAGMEWCVLTDGDEYRLYNAIAAVEADLKLLCQVRISEARQEEAVGVLNLISRSNMSGPMLQEVWQRYHADRRVKVAFRELVDEPDQKLVSLIHRRIPNLSKKEIAASIRHLDIRIEAPGSSSEPGKLPTAILPTRAGKQIKRSQGGIALSVLIDAGILNPPLKLFRRYKGTALEATLLPDGTVEFQGQRYHTPSAAAEAGRKAITGKRLNTNGWSFWQYQSNDGNTFTLDDAREQLAKSRNKSIGGVGKASVTVAQRQGQKSKQDRPERYSIRKRFWEGLLSRPKVQTTRHANISPGEFSWIGAGTGERGLQMVYAIGQDEGRVELRIDRGTGKADENKRIFDRLRQQKGDIEKTFGAELSWQRLDQKQGCRISHPLTLGGYRSDEVKWPAIQDAMIDVMIRLEKALAPHLAKV